MVGHLTIKWQHTSNGVDDFLCSVEPILDTKNIETSLPSTSMKGNKKMRMIWCQKSKWSEQCCNTVPLNKPFIVLLLKNRKQQFGNSTKQPTKEFVNYDLGLGFCLMLNELYDNNDDKVKNSFV